MNDAIQIMPQVLNTAYVIIILALILSSWRLFKGPSVFDRIIALDLIAALVICLAGVFVLETGQTVFLDVAIIIAVITFLSSVAFSRHLERSGGNK